MRKAPRKEIVPVRVTKEEKAALKKRAKKAGWKYWTAYAHYLLFGDEK